MIIWMKFTRDRCWRYRQSRIDEYLNAVYTHFMEKKSYTFEALNRLHRRQKQRKRVKRILAVAFLFFAVITLYMLNNSRSAYYIYKEETETENNDNVSYELFEEGYIKYSKNGIEYQKKFGKSEWNIPVSFQNPILAQSGPYVLLADKGGNTLMLFDVSGKIGELTLKYPIIQADVSGQGITEVILQGEESNFIQIYDREGNLVADMKSSVDGTGYPVSGAISEDGTKLAVSYFALDGMDSKTTLAFYDFSQQLRTDDVTLIGGFDYEDFMIPRLSFVDKHTLAAFGETATLYFDTSDEPRLKKEVRFEQEIKSIFLGEKYLGYVLDNSAQKDEGHLRIQLYTQAGGKKLDTTLDMNYDTICMREGQIIAVRDNECTILNTGGRILFQGELQGASIETILPARGWRTYYVIFQNKTAKMKLRFWNAGSQK